MKINVQFATGKQLELTAEELSELLIYVRQLSTGTTVSLSRQELTEIGQSPVVQKEDGTETMDAYEVVNKLYAWLKAHQQGLFKPGYDPRNMLTYLMGILNPYLKKELSIAQIQSIHRISEPEKQEKESEL